MCHTEAVTIVMLRNCLFLMYAINMRHLLLISGDSCGTDGHQEIKLAGNKAYITKPGDPGVNEYQMNDDLLYALPREEGDLRIAVARSVNSQQEKSGDAHDYEEIVEHYYY